MATPLLKHIQVVAAVIEHHGRILCVQRGPNPRAYISGKWEFPGGKVEQGEEDACALVREIAEELRAPIIVGAHLATVDHSYPDFRLTMRAYLCALVPPVRSVTLTEHVDLQWLDPAAQELTALDWAAADLPIVEALRERVVRMAGTR